MDSFTENILAVGNLVESQTNKEGNGNFSEVTVGELVDALTLDMSDEELIDLRDEYETKSAPYTAVIDVRQKRNKAYYQGLQKEGMLSSDIPVGSNLLFESQETFIPQALAKNPEPVVFSDNTDEGKQQSDDVKTMLQYHADELCLNRTLGRMVRHWSVYLIGIVKHGWDKKAGDITLNIRNPKHFIFDPEGYIDVKGSFVGEYLGERITCNAKKLIEMFPKHKDYITIKVNAKLGTSVTRTEWWTDEFSFTTFGDEVLEKHKNEFFNYPKDEEGLDENDEEVTIPTQGVNHLAHPQMPYTFLSVFSLEEQPHDITNLIEQNITNQNRIIDRDMQVDKNLRSGNNSIVVSGVSFNEETAKQAASAAEDGDPILVPDGRVDDAIKRIPANPLPSGIIESQQIAKDTLRSVFGVQGTGAQPMKSTDTARGMILNQSHDTARTGGGIGDALEQVADNIFNFQLQMYYVFYDEPHYAAIMGSGRAVNYVKLLMSNQKRHFVVSVSPDSMKPKDEVSEMNEAIELWNKGALDPISLFKRLNDPNPLETAKMTAMWSVNKQMYMQMFFPEVAPQQAGGTGENPLDVAPQNGTPETNLSAPEASPALGNVPINAGVAQP
jgi:hypothetical protein